MLGAVSGSSEGLTVVQIRVLGSVQWCVRRVWRCAQTPATCFSLGLEMQLQLFKSVFVAYIHNHYVRSAKNNPQSTNCFAPGYARVYKQGQ